MEAKDWVPVVAIVVTAIVTVITWFVTNALNRAQKLADRRTESYVDFLTAMSRVSNLPRDSAEWKEADIRVLEARHRILLYGSEEVVVALQNLYEGPRFFGQGDGPDRFVRLIRSMQADLSGNQSSREAILRILMWGQAENYSEPELENFSGRDAEPAPEIEFKIS